MPARAAPSPKAGAPPRARGYLAGHPCAGARRPADAADSIFAPVDLTEGSSSGPVAWLILTRQDLPIVLEPILGSV